MSPFRCMQRGNGFFIFTNKFFKSTFTRSRLALGITFKLMLIMQLCAAEPTPETFPPTNSITKRILSTVETAKSYMPSFRKTAAVAGCTALYLTNIGFLSNKTSAPMGATPSELRSHGVTPFQNARTVATLIDPVCCLATLGATNLLSQSTAGQLLSALSCLGASVKAALINMPDGNVPPTANCTYYYEYLAQNPLADSILGNFSCDDTALNLANKGIGAEGASAIAPALKQLASLQVVELQKNNLGASGAAFLTPALQQLSLLYYLDMSDNEIGDEGVAAMSAALPQLLWLQYLLLNNNNISSSGMLILAPALQYNVNMRGLSLANNKIGDNGTEALAPALQQFTNLFELDLNENSIGANGATALAHALLSVESTSLIQLLNMGNNNIGSNGAISLSHTLRTLPLLYFLDMSNNEIGDEGARPLAAALQSSTKIGFLGLDGNNIGGSGTEALASALSGATNLMVLSMNNNDIGDSSAMLLADTLQWLNNLTLVSLNNSQIDSVTCESFKFTIHQGSPNASVFCWEPSTPQPTIAPSTASPTSSSAAVSRIHDRL